MECIFSSLFPASFSGKQAATSYPALQDKLYNLSNFIVVDEKSSHLTNKQCELLPLNWLYSAQNVKDHDRSIVLGR